MGKEQSLILHLEDFHGRYQNLICRVCDKELVDLDEIVRRLSSHNRKKYYHKECWERCQY